MAIDEKLSQHVRAALGDARSVEEVKMFGGLGFMLNGNMVVAASAERGLLVRVGEVGMAEAIARGAAPMVMNGRTMKDYARAEGTLDAKSVAAWVRLARAFVDTLPAKKRDAKSAPRKRKKP